ncbi:Uncharacterised protein [Mycobacteroides abscessus subsp. abscessus]|nr:Uncharacterised protein [Mycobacteroides abscessus subsp. abscessus]
MLRSGKPGGSAAAVVVCWHAVISAAAHITWAIRALRVCVIASSSYWIVQVVL